MTQPENPLHRVRAALAEVLDHFRHDTHPGERCKQTGHVRVATIDRWRAVLDDTAEAAREDGHTGAQRPGCIVNGTRYHCGTDTCPCPPARAIAAAELEQLRTELALLHEGEEPHPEHTVIETPAQWIYRWNRVTPEQRLAGAEQAIRDALRAGRCFLENHEQRLAAPTSAEQHVRGLDREQLHQAIRELARTDPDWWHQQLRRRALFLAEGGHVTCGSLDCPNPDAVNQMLEAATAEPARQDGHTAPSDAASDPDGESHPEPASDRETGVQRFESPTVIHRTPDDLRAQRARLIASTGLTEPTLRQRAADFALYPEHLEAWTTVEGIDYLLDQPGEESAADFDDQYVDRDGIVTPDPPIQCGLATAARCAGCDCPNPTACPHVGDPA